MTYFDHSSGPLQSELSKGKFTILPCRDPNGAAIALFNLSLHEPGEVSHQTVLQCVVFQVTDGIRETEPIKIKVDATANILIQIFAG